MGINIMRLKMSRICYSVFREILIDFTIIIDRKRYVVYAKKDLDASQVPAEWHAWLHYISDEPPTTGEYASHFFQKGHSENLSGTAQRYVPYSTVGPKIIKFDPKDISNHQNHASLPEQS